ncbi:MAG: hypothetical protein RL701_7275 [Pseudomonadota bacterium]
MFEDPQHKWASELAVELELRAELATDREIGREHADYTDITRVVALGVGDAGWPALQRFFIALEDGCGLAIIIVQHACQTGQTGQTSAARLAQLIDLPIVELLPYTAPRPLAPDHVFIAPPGVTVELVEGLLTATQLAPHAEHTAIDHVFRSLAHALGPSAAGVVLPGAGSDGALGVQALARVGAATFAVQAPHTRAPAAVSDMLDSAIATGCVQHVLSPFQIAQALAEPPTLEYAITARAARPKTREQLEQDNRELTRANRELLGVHGELQQRISELQVSLLYAQFHASGLVQAHANVSTLLSGTAIALIELDAQLCVQGYSGDVSQLYGLTPEDIGKPLAQVEHRAQHMPALPPCLELLHASQAAQLDEADVVTADRWYVRRILPRALHVNRADEQKRAPSARARAMDSTGAVLVFIDVTKLKDSEAWAEGLSMTDAAAVDSDAYEASASMVS